MKSSVISNYSVDFATAAHSRDLPKPNEDRYIADKENGIFIVLDGVTRVHSEYDDCPNRSAACDVGDIFLDTVYPYLLAHSDESPQIVLIEAIRLANSEIFKYRSQKTELEWGFYPSTLGIVSILRENTLYYVCVGDCLGVLIRNNSKILFGKQWQLEAVDALSVSKKDRYGLYCNKPENPLSYAVFDGDEFVMSGLELSCIDIRCGDTVLLVSDGLGCCVKYEKASILRSLSATELISLSEKYDCPPHAMYSDDKTIVKICFDFT